MILLPTPPTPPAPSAPYFTHLSHCLSSHLARLTANRPHRILPTLSSLSVDKGRATLEVVFEDTGERWAAGCWFTPREASWLAGAGKGLPPTGPALPIAPSALSLSTFSTPSAPVSRSASYSLARQEREEEEARERVKKRVERELFTRERLALLGCTTGYPTVWGSVLNPPEGLPRVVFSSLPSLRHTSADELGVREEGGRGASAVTPERWAKATREQRERVLRALARGRAEAVRGSVKATRWYAEKSAREVEGYSAEGWFGEKLDRRVRRVREGRGELWEEVRELEGLREEVGRLLRRVDALGGGGDALGEREDVNMGSDEEGQAGVGKGKGKGRGVLQGVPMLAHPVLDGESVWATEDWEVCLQVTDNAPTPIPPILLLSLPSFLLPPSPSASPSATPNLGASTASRSTSRSSPSFALRASTRLPFKRLTSLTKSRTGREGGEVPQSDVKGELLWGRQVYVQALLDSLREFGLLAVVVPEDEPEPMRAARSSRSSVAASQAVESVTMRAHASEVDAEVELEQAATPALSPPSEHSSAHSTPPSTKSKVLPRLPLPQLEEADVRTLLSDQYLQSALLAASGLGGKPAWDSWERARKQREEENAAQRRLRRGDVRPRAVGAGFLEPREVVMRAQEEGEGEGGEWRRSDWSYHPSAHQLRDTRASLGVSMINEGGRRAPTPGSVGQELGDRLSSLPRWSGGRWEGPREVGAASTRDSRAGEGEEEEDGMSWERSSGWTLESGNAKSGLRVANPGSGLPSPALEGSPTREEEQEEEEEEKLDRQELERAVEEMEADVALRGEIGGSAFNSVLDQDQPSQPSRYSQPSQVEEESEPLDLGQLTGSSPYRGHAYGHSHSRSLSPELAELRRIRAALFPDSVSTFNFNFDSPRLPYDEGSFSSRRGSRSEVLPEGGQTEGEGGEETKGAWEAHTVDQEEAEKGYTTEGIVPRLSRSVGTGSALSPSTSSSFPHAPFISSPATGRPGFASPLIGNSGLPEVVERKRIGVPDFVATLSGSRKTSFLDFESDATPPRCAEYEPGERRSSHQFASPPSPSRSPRARAPSSATATTSTSTSSATRPFLLPRTHDDTASDSDAQEDAFGAFPGQVFPNVSRASLPYALYAMDRRSRTDSRASYPAYPTHLQLVEQAEDVADIYTYHTAHASTIIRSPSGVSSPRPTSAYPALLHPAAAQDSDLYGGALNITDESDRRLSIASSSSLSSLGTLVGPTSDSFVVDRWDPPTPRIEQVAFPGAVPLEEIAPLPHPTPSPAPSATATAQTAPSRPPSSASTSSNRTNRIKRVPVPAYIPELDFERSSSSSPRRRTESASTAGTRARTESMSTIDEHATPDLTVSAGEQTPVHRNGFDSTSPTTPSSANDIEDVEIASPISPTTKEMHFHLQVDAPSRPSLEGQRKTPTPPVAAGMMQRKESVRQKTRRVIKGVRASRVGELIRRMG